VEKEQELIKEEAVVLLLCLKEKEEKGKMEYPKCQICGGRGITIFGSKRICGECLMKVLKKQQEEKDKLLEELKCQ